MSNFAPVNNVKQRDYHIVVATGGKLLMIIILFEYTSTAQQLREMTYIILFLSLISRSGPPGGGGGAVYIHKTSEVSREGDTFVLPTASFLIHHRSTTRSREEWP